MTIPASVDGFQVLSPSLVMCLGCEKIGTLLLSDRSKSPQCRTFGSALPLNSSPPFTHRFRPSNPHSPQLPFHRLHAYVKACTPDSLIRPTSAPSHEDIATRTRRKWGARRRGESNLSLWVSGDLREILGVSSLPCPAFRQSVAANHHSARILSPDN